MASKRQPYGEYQTAYISSEFVEKMAEGSQIDLFMSKCAHLSDTTQVVTASILQIWHDKW